MKNEVIRKATKETIFRQAAELFSKSGYYNVSVREICEAAEVTKPVLYYYFDDKENLLMEMIKETHKIFERLIAKWVIQAPTFEKSLDGIIYLYIEFIQQYPHLVKFSSFIQSMMVPDNVRRYKIEEAEKSWNNFVEFLKEAKKNGFVAPDIDLYQLSRNFIGSVLVILWEYMLGGCNVEELEEKLFKFLEFWKQQFIITKN